jgi:hypothetical protein
MSERETGKSSMTDIELKMLVGMGGYARAGTHLMSSGLTTSLGLRGSKASNALLMVRMCACKHKSQAAHDDVMHRTL